MAVFIDIRNKLGPIIVIIIGLALGVFVLETALNSNSNLLRGNRDVVGSIDGNKIHLNEYQDEIQKEVSAYKLNKGQDPSDLDNNQIHKDAWTQLINTKFESDFYSKVGIGVSDAELKDMFYGNDPDPRVRQIFENPKTHQFDPMAVKNFVSTLDQKREGDMDPAVKRAKFQNIEDYVINERLKTKAQNLFKNGIYVPKWMAEEVYNERNTKYNFDYIQVPFSSISDSSIKVSDDELKTYLEQNKEKYKQTEETRKIEYALFKVNPSVDDTTKAKTFVQDAYKKLNENNVDTNFVKQTADRALDRFYYSKDKVYEDAVKDSLFKIRVGGVIAPFYSGNTGTYYTAKLIDKRIMPDSVKTSVIVFAKQQGADTAKIYKKADSVYNLVRAGAPFDSLAARFSDDKNTGSKGGDIGYVKQGMTFKEIEDFLFFNASQGEVKLINTKQGYFIVKATELVKINEAVKFYLFSKKVEASSKTNTIVYDHASQFASKNNAGDAFAKSFKEDRNLMKQTIEAAHKGDYQVPGLENAREIISWAFKSEPNAVSPVIQTQNNYVVAHMVSVVPEGIPPVASIRAQIEPMVRNQKKAQKISAEISAALALNSTFEAIATKFNTDIKNVPSGDFSQPNLPAGGYEPAVYGAVASLKEGQASKPVSGVGGVYLAKLNSVVKPVKVADYKSIQQQQANSVQMQMMYGVGGGVMEMLKKKMKVEDYRFNFPSL